LKKSRGRRNDASDESSPKLHLRVLEAKHRDLGKRRARIDSNSMRRMGIEPGEVIELVGKRKTPVTAWPSDQGRARVILSGSTVRRERMQEWL